MELGNIFFGNSRGEISIERGAGWEEELSRLFDAYAARRDNSWREYGEEFENDTFSVFPYYWGDCTCGYDEKEYEFYNSINHKPECYQTEYMALDKQYGMFGLWAGRGRTKEEIEKNRHEIYLLELVKLYKKYNLEYNKECIIEGCAIRCSCDYDAKAAIFHSNNKHIDNCPIIRPNFKHKKSGFEIQWYKYPLRDSYKNQDISLDEFRVIINDCIESITGCPKPLHLSTSVKKSHVVPRKRGITGKEIHK